MEILCNGHLVVQLTPSTEMTVPAPPRRWFGRAATASFHGGEARILTGPRFRGSRLTVVTDEARVEVTGTTLAVIRDAEGTCVCVFEGAVAVGARGDEPERVATGLRRFHYKGSRPAATLPIDDMENAKLSMFQDRARPLLEGPGR